MLLRGPHQHVLYIGDEDEVDYDEEEVDLAELGFDVVQNSREMDRRWLSRRRSIANDGNHGVGHLLLRS